MSAASADKDAQHLSEARESSERFAASLPQRIDAAALTLKSKLPFKALSIRELLLHRMAALSSAAADLFAQKRVIPAVILTRAIVETLAVLFTFHERLKRFLEDKKKDIDAMDDFLMRCLVGARNNPEMPTSTNILTLIDRLEKTVPGFRDVYDALCECAHPNWAGTFGAFGEVDHEKLGLKLGAAERSPAYSSGLASLSGSLMAFEHYYNDSAELVRRFNDYFENARHDT
ncbi:MAG: hypothetical protein HYY46_12675 [Deltaproteobacteria bacterium]|nr:hypothetical protein [Deltaproteobacteria bacterium]